MQAGPDDVGVIGLEAAARQLGSWCWAERRLFEILGGWVRDTPEAPLKAMFASHSRHHAWRAERWAEVLPNAYVPAPEQLIVGGAATDLFDLVARLELSALRAAAHYHVVYPALLAAYEASPVVMNPVTDGPALRAIRIIVGDAQHDLTEAESVCRRLPGGISDLVHLTQLRNELAKMQVSGAEVGKPVSMFRRWGS